MTDTELIKGCIREDGDCQKALFNRYASTLLGVCQRYARNKEDAEDILQDSFIKIFNKIGQFYVLKLMKYQVYCMIALKAYKDFTQRNPTWLVPVRKSPFPLVPIIYLVQY